MTLLDDLSIVEILARLVLAVAVGAIVGLEREMGGHAAGFRTHMLVGLGAGLFTLAGTATTGDPARVAAQVASGIGFLGAGAILKEGLGIRGLTTAASLWVTAAGGLAAGFGAYAATGISAGVVLVVLIAFKKVEEDVLPRRRGQLITLHLERTADLSETVAAARRVLGADARVAELNRGEEHQQRVTLVTHLRTDVDAVEVCERLRGLESIAAIELTR